MYNDYQIYSLIQLKIYNKKTLKSLNNMKNIIYNFYKKSIYLKIVTVFMFFFIISICMQKMQLNENENNSLNYLKILKSITLKDFVNKQQYITYIKNL